MSNPTTTPVRALITGDVIVWDGDDDRAGLVLGVCVGDATVQVLFSTERVNTGSRWVTFASNEEVQAVWHKCQANQTGRITDPDTDEMRAVCSVCGD